MGNLWKEGRLYFWRKPIAAWNGKFHVSIDEGHAGQEGYLVKHILSVSMRVVLDEFNTIKDQSDMDLREAEYIKKGWQEYTEELYKKGLKDSDNDNGVISYQEADILECKVKWVLGSTAMNKTSGGEGILAELFQILKDDAVKMLHSMWQQIWNSQ